MRQISDKFQIIPKIILGCFLVLLLNSCQSSRTVELITLNLPTGQINSNPFIPNSFVFDQVPQAFADGYVYLDKSVGSIIFLSADFSFKDTQLVQGDGPDLLNQAYSISIVGEQLFVHANDRIGIFDQNTKEFKVVDWPFRLDDWVQKWNGEYLVGHVLPDSNQYYISSFQFDSLPQVVNIQHKVQIPFLADLDYLEYSGHCLTFDEHLIFIKDWHGEVFKINAEYEITESKKLPYSGPEDFQFENFEGEKMSQFFQAYGAAKIGTSIAILRELDFESGAIDDLTDVDEKLVRKKIHVLDLNLNLIKSIQIPEYATEISYDFKNELLFTLHGSDEKVFYYHFPLSLLQ
jgi:hypothetical protein